MSIDLTKSIILSKADKMFLELGYEFCDIRPFYYFYYKELIIDDEGDVNEMDTQHITFNYKTKTISKTFGDDTTVSDITISELQAINEKVKELGWIRDDK